MRIKIFSAPSMHEALAKVRQEMGPDALILDRQQSESADGKKLWHVHAALDDNNTPAPAISVNSPTTVAPDTVVLRHHQTDAALERLERIVEGLGNKESGNLRQALVRADEQEAFDHLTRLGVSASHAFDMAADFSRQQPLGQKSLQWGKRINPQQKPCTLLFSGPSGCGKSTLIAKLAAHYSMKGVRVAVLSTDTERMGGLDILKAYASTLGIDFHPVRRAADASIIQQREKSAQLLLIDTEGWSPRRDTGLKRQGEVWDALHCNRRFLLLPANMDEEDAMQQLKHPAISKMTDIAFSRLDETQKPGKIINWSFASGLPMSYCSFGPEVPEQMGWLNAQGLTTLLSKHHRENMA
ncbi:MAG: GTP-binding protein [Mariprofundus sp.]|nr:GTP-binding protein [Mariprofundus sp.]